MPTSAGIIIIGDEILKGEVIDINSTFLCKRFRALGVKVLKISTIPDDLKLIADEVALFSKLYDVVITSGGVGPTHDDLTYESVAAAFNSTLIINEELKQFFDWYLCKGNNEGLQLVTIPSCSEILYPNLDELLDGKSTYPIVKTFNVYNFPGLPFYLQKTFIGLQREHFTNTNVQFFNRTIYLKVDEILVVNTLHQINDQFKQTVTIGSYPRTSESDKYETKITIESFSMEHCLNVERELLLKIPPSWLTHIPFKLPDFEFIQRLSFMNTELSTKIRNSFQIIKDCFDKYPVSETFIGFNGGKDCTVVLNLVCCYCFHQNISLPLTLVYFKDKNSFPELDEFIDFIKTCYKVEILVLPTPMKTSLSTFLSNEPKKSACFLGLRSNDPKSENLKPIQETDEDWPKIMRIFPILHWNYQDVWKFIRCVNIPYSSLYDQGYTSLGHRNNTKVNAELKFVDENGSIYFRPAFLLDEEHLERGGR